VPFLPQDRYLTSFVVFELACAPDSFFITSLYQSVRIQMRIWQGKKLLPKDTRPGPRLAAGESFPRVRIVESSGATIGDAIKNAGGTPASHSELQAVADYLNAHPDASEVASVKKYICFGAVSGAYAPYLAWDGYGFDVYSSRVGGGWDSGCRVVLK
jgi:hypothetical protein